MQVSEFMTTNVTSCNENETVEVAAKLMIEKGFSVLPVVDSSGVLVGILTESDFVGKEANIPHALVSIKKLFGTNVHLGDVEEIYKKAKTKKLSEVMAKNVKTIAKTATLSEVVNMMSSHNLKRLPVVDGGKLVGIVTRKDLIKAFGKIKG